MPIISFADKTYTLNDNESILECLMRHGIDYPHSCQAGICQSCLIKGRGIINPTWQEGVQDSLKSQGYFLACLAKPKEDIQVIAPLTEECEVTAKIIGIEKLTYNVIQVKLYVDDFTPWISGQYLNLINSEGTIRSYSIANIPNEDGFIELHIKLEEQGLMGKWFKKTAHVNKLIYIRGPLGRCFYFNPSKLTYDILLVGTGTGLSPLIGIAKQALFQNHQGKITLLHGGRIHEDLYYVKELEKLTSENSTFHYENCIWKNASGEYNPPIDQVVLKYIQEPKNLRVFVCGPQEITQKIKTKVFCAGVPSSQILSDAFI